MGSLCHAEFIPFRLTRDIESDVFSSCSCDLSATCDVNCCCDSDCSEDDILLFSECQTPPPSRFRLSCVRKKYVSRSNKPNEVDDGSAFCVKRDGNPQRNFYFPLRPANKVAVDTISAASCGSDFLAAFQFAEAVDAIDALAATYSVNDPIIIKTGDNQSSFFDVVSGMQSLTGCSSSSHVRFGKPMKSKCTVEISNPVHCGQLQFLDPRYFDKRILATPTGTTWVIPNISLNGMASKNSRKLCVFRHLFDARY